ncbi:MAG: hypothetical protein ACW99G_19185 [Candidatus Thorarchaeota archaeon]|jgi:hypothetical protein
MTVGEQPRVISCDQHYAEVPVKKKREIQYDPEALKKNIEKCDENITLFQEAISKEYRNKADLERLLEKAKKE